MEELSAAWWNNRYLNDTAAWDVGNVSLPLKDYFDQLTDKTITILIPGAGNAYEAEYLHRQGFTNVYICDIAEQPLKNFSQRCPDFNSEHLLQQDFFELPEGKFDLMVEQTFFCAIDRGLRSAYAEKVQRLLKPGGHLVGVLFNEEFEKAGPPFGGSAAEYTNYFKNKFTFKTFEPAYNSIQPRAGKELFINLVKAA